MNLMIIFLLTFLGLVGNLTVYAQQSASIELEVKYWNGDLVDPTETQITIFQDGNAEFKTIKLSTNPQIISGIPQGHNYSFEILRHGIHIFTSNTILLNSDLEKTVLIIPPEGGMKFKVYYNDGYTPIQEAKVVIRSTNNAPLISTITNNEGQTQRYWLQSTKPDEFYFAEISLGTGITYLYSPVKLVPEVPRDFKITTPWPPLIDDLITVSIYQGNQKISKDDGSFIVQVFDKKNKKVDESSVNIRGEAFFSKLQVGEYNFIAIQITPDKTSFQTWGSTKMILTGKENHVTINNEIEGLKLKETGCNCVGFRLDDVQDYSLTQAQMRIIDLFNKKNAGLTIGVIGGLIGEDKNIVEFIKEKLRNSNFDLEIASHSWNNSPMTSYSKERQDSTLKSTNVQLKKIFGAVPTLFIPPENVFNQDTLDVLKLNNFTHLSSSFNYDVPPYPLTSSSFYRFPQGAQTAVFDYESNLWITEKREKIFDDVITSINNYGYAVVMMHPPDFSINDNGIYRNNVDEKQIENLELLIDDLLNIGLKIVPISKINLDSKTIDVQIDQKDNMKELDKKTQTPNCKCVAFSIDSIQDYWLNDVQLKIFQTFEKSNTDLTVGIIGGYFGSDEKLVNYLQGLLINNEIEIANNGWDYEDHTKLTLDEQSLSLKKGNERIENLFNVKSKTFLPPFDKMNENTIRAMKENGMDYLSSSKFSDSTPYNFTSEAVIHLPYGVTTSKFEPELNHFVGISHEESLSKIKFDIENNGFSVVRLNPQEFSIIQDGIQQNKINTNHLNELVTLIEKIKQIGYKTILVQKIPLLMNNSIEIPDWIKNNALWWADNKISESDFVSGIEFMIKNGIMQIPHISETETTGDTIVPHWIKNNAEWWGNGLISDADFVSGIEYMIKNGIIRI